MSFSITLCDRNPEIVKSWRRYFPGESGVRVASQNILTLSVDALAVPANAFGFTDGGVDMAISHEIFDWGMQDRLRRMIDTEYAGELLVGQAMAMTTRSTRFPYVIVAPTMRVPADVSTTVNAYLSMRAIMLAVLAHNKTAALNERIASIGVPGLCAGTGKMPPDRVAYQMWMAYRSVLMGDREWMRTLPEQVEHDRKMRERA